MAEQGENTQRKNEPAPPPKVQKKSIAELLREREAKHVIKR